MMFAWSQMAYSYVHNQTKSGINVHWPIKNLNNTVNIYVNSANNQGISSVQTIAQNSINEWNGLSKIVLQKNTTSLKGQNNFNEIYFSNDPSIFGAGVIGITQLSYSQTNGEIVSADILINDDIVFSTTQTDEYFLGNVITHEVGHFLGLGHGQVSGSTMFYALTRGQSTLSEDDKAATYSNYSNGDSTKGSLSGTMVGGKSLVKVFGAHVQAISVKTGKVMGAAISEFDGKFKINGLPVNDQYLIYSSPLAQVGLPSNYANVKNNFCESSTNYRGSFFQSCGASSEGFPQAVKLSSSLVNIGNITIRCSLDGPPTYIQNKSTTPANFDINEDTFSGYGGSFVGFFQGADVQDYFKADFSNIDAMDWDTLLSSTDPHPNLFVELKVINQSFNSIFKANVNYKYASTLTDVTPKYNQETDGRINIDTVVRLPINRSSSSDNVFEIKITPENIMTNPYDSSGIPFYKIDIFPAYSLGFQDGFSFYLVIATIVQDQGDGVYKQVASKNDQLSDNSTCTDAIKTYALNNFITNGISTTNARKKYAGCGIIVDQSNSSGGGGGPGGFMAGILICFIVSFVLSRYSKMA